jgi:hypothetical protein
MKMGDWLIPFRGRNYSGTYSVNFLWRYQGVYIMDNHRAALWCWLQHVDPLQPVSLLHVDRHYDTLYSRMGDWLSVLPDLTGITIDEYLGLQSVPIAGTTHPLFRWDNFVSIFLEKWGHNLKHCCFATHGEGDKPRHPRFSEYDVWELPENLPYLFANSAKAPWICDIDLDYFFYSARASEYRLLLSREYLHQIISTVREAYGRGDVKVVTISLSPEWCGGWLQSEQLCDVVCDLLGVPFQLPSATSHHA